MGPNYHNARVAILGHNLREAGGLFDELCVASDVRRLFGEGRKKPHDSWFAYRSTLGAAAAIVSSRGEQLQDDEPDPPDLIPAFDSCAKLQAVKCSPFDSQLSTPTDEMTTRCPDRYLMADLNLLSPRTLLVQGAPARETVMRLFPGEWGNQPQLHHRTVTLGSTVCEIYCLAHPASHKPQWSESWSTLKEALELAAL